MTFRYATEEDCNLILSFIRGLASYEKMSDQVVVTEELLREWTTYRLTGDTLMEMAKCGWRSHDQEIELLMEKRSL